MVDLQTAAGPAPEKEDGKQPEQEEKEPLEEEKKPESLPKTGEAGNLLSVLLGCLAFILLAARLALKLGKASRKEKAK